MRPIGILGGTFDPIHFGHIRLALESCRQLDMQQVRFIPVNIPPHRDLPVASAADRKAMIELVLAEHEKFVIDQRELDRQETSYTIDTLKSLRQEQPEIPLCLIVGRDAFARIDSWYQWQSLLDHAHIIVASRPGDGNDLSGRVKEWAKIHSANGAANLHQHIAGLIYFMEIPLTDISSTEVRAALAAGQPVDAWLHPSTLEYIKQHQLYQDAA